MKIIVRKDSKMSVARPERIDDETELQELILRNPSIIPVDEIRGGASELVFAIKEFWTGSIAWTSWLSVQAATWLLWNARR